MTNAAQVPLIELLQRVPEDARHSYEHSPTHHSMIPFGRYCHEAAATISTLESRLQEAEKNASDMEKLAQAASDDAERAIQRARAAERQLAEVRAENERLNGEVSCHQEEMDGWESDFNSERASRLEAESERDTLTLQVAGLRKALEKIVHDWDGEPEDMFDARQALASAAPSLPHEDAGDE